MIQSDQNANPNLIPLLDLVLQMIMFFMLCANFMAEQTSDKVNLPEAVAAKPLDKQEEYVIFLNITKQGEVELSTLDAIGDDRTLTNPERVRTYMKRRYDEDMRAAKPGQKDKGPRSLVILRADKETPFEKVYAIMTACRQAGYERAQLRVILHGGSD